MRAFLLAQFRTRKSRTAALGGAVLVAAVSFTVLAAAARTSAIQVEGTVESNYRAAYDVLVRPRRSTTALEDRQSLVRPNFLSGVFGGIKMRQWRDVKAIPGVDVAAPIANIGYILPAVDEGLILEDVLDEAPEQVYRIRGRSRAQRDMSNYPSQSRPYVYFSKDRPLRFADCDLSDATTPLARGTTSPFASSVYLECFTRAQSERDEVVDFYRHLVPSGTVGLRIQSHVPIFMSAIDPVEESRLLELDKAVVAGRFLEASDNDYIVDRSWARVRTIPVIASSRPFLDERLELTIEELPWSPSRFPTLTRPQGKRFLESLPGVESATKTLLPTAFYRRLIKGSFNQSGRVDLWSFWTTSPTKYRSLGNERLTPAIAKNDVSVWESPLQSGGGGGLGYTEAPAANADVQFRRLESHPSDNRVENDTRIYRMPFLKIVGQFDPERLPGFSPLSEVPLETYYPPLLEGADERSRRLLGNRPLLPTQNLGDYIQQPPLFLTTLKAIEPIFNPRNFARVDGRAAAPISAIRVRVAGVTGPDDLSQARVHAVAQQIHERTGLQVDITAGSSPKPILVELPAGKFGRPELLLREGWSKKGAAVSFVEALDRKSIGLSALILLVAGFFVGNGALASVRSRRQEIGTLRTVGWSTWSVFAVVLGEVMLVGLIAGLVGVGVSLAAAKLFGLDLALWQALLVVPLGLGLALLAGLLPAWQAARVAPLEAVRPPVAAARRAWRVRRISALALANLTRVPGRTLLAAAALVIGVGALTSLVAIQKAFEGVLVDTLLGNAISFQVRGADLAAVGLLIVLAGVSIADVLFLSLRERSVELATLRTFGWADRDLARLVATESALLGLTATLAGAALGTLVAVQLAVPVQAALLAAALAAAGGIAITMLATLLPLLHLRRLTPTAALASE